MNESERQIARSQLETVLTEISKMKREQRDKKLVFRAPTVERNAEGYVVGHPVRELSTYVASSIMDRIRNRFVQLEALRGLRGKR